MTRPIVVVRPEPGNAATADRLAEMGLEAVRLPLFAVRRVGWLAPDPADHDALLITSANAMRHAGPQLERLRDLPVLAVGATTAAAARLAGFEVSMQGTADAATLLRQASRAGMARALHLAGRQRTVTVGGPVSAVITVYASDAVAVDADRLNRLGGSIVLLHSARAARRLAELVVIAQRPAIRLAALSSTIADAAGVGWDTISVSATPDDAALLAAARGLIE